jgi:uncharacterized protein involved in type VI secretion and phage assembly
MNPIRRTGATITGVMTGLVTENNDEEGLCRVKVSYPWHDNPVESYWARLAMPMAGSGRGVVLIPEVGDEVLVSFEGGDIRSPYVLGSLWNKKDRPPVSNDDGKNNKRGVVSRKNHSLIFDDGENGTVELAHEKGGKITFHDHGFAVQDENGNVVKVDSASGAMTIEATGQLSIKAASISIEASGSIAVKASGTLTLLGSLVTIN